SEVRLGRQAKKMLATIDGYVGQMTGSIEKRSADIDARIHDKLTHSVDCFLDELPVLMEGNLFDEQSLPFSNRKLVPEANEHVEQLCFGLECIIKYGTVDQQLRVYATLLLKIYNHLPKNGQSAQTSGYFLALRMLADLFELLESAIEKKFADDRSGSQKALNRISRTISRTASTGLTLVPDAASFVENFVSNVETLSNQAGIALARTGSALANVGVKEHSTKTKVRQAAQQLKENFARYAKSDFNNAKDAITFLRNALDFTRDTFILNNESPCFALSGDLNKRADEVALRIARIEQHVEKICRAVICIALAGNADLLVEMNKLIKSAYDCYYGLLSSGKKSARIACVTYAKAVLEVLLPYQGLYSIFDKVSRTEEERREVLRGKRGDAASIVLQTTSEPIPQVQRRANGGNQQQVHQQTVSLSDFSQMRLHDNQNGASPASYPPRPGGSPGSYDSMPLPNVTTSQSTSRLNTQQSWRHTSVNDLATMNGTALQSNHHFLGGRRNTVQGDNPICINGDQAERQVSAPQSTNTDPVNAERPTNTNSISMPILNPGAVHVMNDSDNDMSRSPVTAAINEFGFYANNGHVQPTVNGNGYAQPTADVNGYPQPAVNGNGYAQPTADVNGYPQPAVNNMEDEAGNKKQQVVEPISGEKLDIDPEWAAKFGL
ncbi:MAG: hypothetical protein ACK4PR_03945, partial [Gammaproteobacteria bacterium]